MKMDDSSRDSIFYPFVGYTRIPIKLTLLGERKFFSETTSRFFLQGKGNDTRAGASGYTLLLLNQ